MIYFLFSILLVMNLCCIMTINKHTITRQCWLKFKSENEKQNNKLTSMINELKQYR